jgi:hypothetical protein
MDKLKFHRVLKQENTGGDFFMFNIHCLILFLTSSKLDAFRFI